MDILKPHFNLHNLVDSIIKRRKRIEKIFILLVIISAICFPFVNVNYDLSKYLPENALSKQGINIMEDEFGYPGQARVMIRDVSLYEAKIYKDKIANVDGVDMVMWADAKTDIYQSNLFIQYDKIEDYYKDGYSVMDITFKEGDSSNLTHKAIDEIKGITGDKGYFAGSAVQDKFLKESLFQEMAIAGIIIIFAIAGILCLTTNSWFEPVLFLTVIFIAIVINMGSNIFMGNISFLTYSVAAVLQLAIAMDYAIILLDAFTRERQKGLTAEQAIANAIKSSITPILSAGGAAIVGFLALVLMRYTIGKDLGLVLAKGIAISMVTVMFLMPALILRWYGKIEKTAHRPFLPSFRRFGEKVYQMRYLFLIIALLVTIPAYVGKGMTSFTFGKEAMGSSEGTEVYEDEQAINAHFDRDNLILVLVPNSSMVSERMLSDELENLPYTKNVTSLPGMLQEGVPESMIPKSITKDLHTDHYARMLVSIRTASESDLAFRYSDEIKGIVQKYYPENSYLVGVTPSTQDIKAVIVDDFNSVDLLSLLGVAIAIMLAFRSVILPIILMIPIQIAVFINMLMPYLMGDRLMFIGYIIVSCLQLGATIDYSILMTNHYLEYRKRTDKIEASIQATAASALPILASGTILAVVGYGLYFVSSVTAIADLGRLVGRGAVFSMLLVLTLLPNLFILSDRLIFHRKIDWKGIFNMTKKGKEISG